MSDPQIEHWNGAGGARWAAAHERIDAHFAAITDALFAFAAPRTGERCLDVGCGTAATTRELHRRTGAHAVGIDVSAQLVAIARARVPEASFVLADAATHALAPDFELAFSRFGVMFFADPVAAFANIRRALAPGGRLAFACWRAVVANAWAAVPLAVARPLLPPQPPADPLAPGPFAFADATRVHDVLAAAGFRDVAVTPFDTAAPFGATVDDAAAEMLAIGPVARQAAELDADTRAEIARRIAAAFAPFATSAGVRLPAAVWLVGAR